MTINTLDIISTRISSLGKSVLLRFKIIILIVFLFAFAKTNAQIFNVNFNDLNFGDVGVTITPKVGDGKSVGDIVLYENIVTISGQQLDAIVRTQVITNGSITTFDYTGSGQNNQERWFSPQANFSSGGGSIEFKIEFILGASYVDATNTGDIITLQDIVLNSYDIDGNGNTNSNQFCDFGGFDASELGSPTNLEYSFDPVSGLTRFRSTSNVNTPDAFDEKNRVKLTYSFISTMDVKLGAEGNGAAYYFLDFSGGDTFDSSTTVVAPVLDLDTYTVGIDNDTVFSGNPVSFTKGDTNIIYSGTTIENLTIEFDNTMLLNGASEKLLFNGSGGAQLSLNFVDAQTVTNLTISGVTVSTKVTVVATTSTLILTKNGGGSFTLAEAEMLLDAIDYHNDDANPTSATRVFDVTAKDSSFQTGVAVFTIIYSNVLPVELVGFSAEPVEQSVELTWSTVTEVNNDYFAVQRSSDLSEWGTIGTVWGNGTTMYMEDYDFTDPDPLKGFSYYRLKQVDFNGICKTSEVRAVEIPEDNILLIADPYSGSNQLIVPEDWEGMIHIIDLYGGTLFQQAINTEELLRIDINAIAGAKGKLIVTCYSNSGHLETFSILKQ